MRPPDPRALLLLALLATPAQGQAAPRYLIYLHGRIVEDAGRHPTDSAFGSYDYDAILDSLRRPGFVVLDFNLPDLNAPAALADPLLRALPVLVLTQIPGPADERAVLAAGARAYHGKPSRAAALRELLVDFWRTHGDPGRR